MPARQDLDGELPVGTEGVEVRRLMVVEVHHDGQSVEASENGHSPTIAPNQPQTLTCLFPRPPFYFIVASTDLSRGS
jgi:hypothetical protein